MRRCADSTRCASHCSTYRFPDDSKHKPLLPWRTKRIRKEGVQGSQDAFAFSVMVRQPGQCRTDCTVYRAVDELRPFVRRTAVRSTGHRHRTNRLGHRALQSTSHCAGATCQRGHQRCQLHRRRAALEAVGGYPIPPSQTPWQEIQRTLVSELSEGMVLTPAVKYQRVHATFGLPRNNH